jgi:hypothetical protein
MELKFELDTRLTVSCVATMSIALSTVPLAFMNAIVLLTILVVLFGLKVLLTRKPTAVSR